MGTYMAMMAFVGAVRLVCPGGRLCGYHHQGGGYGPKAVERRRLPSETTAAVYVLAVSLVLVHDAMLGFVSPGNRLCPHSTTVEKKGL